MSNLEDHKRQHIIGLLKQGEDLPPKYKQRTGLPDIQRMSKNFMREARAKNATVQNLRNTFEMMHAYRGYKLNSIQEVVGGADLKTPSIYVQMVREQLRRDLTDRPL